MTRYSLFIAVLLVVLAGHVRSDDPAPRKVRATPPAAVLVAWESGGAHGEQLGWLLKTGDVVTPVLPPDAVLSIRAHPLATPVVLPDASAHVDPLSGLMAIAVPEPLSTDAMTALSESARASGGGAHKPYLVQRTTAGIQTVAFEAQPWWRPLTTPWLDLHFTICSVPASSARGDLLVPPEPSSPAIALGDQHDGIQLFVSIRRLARIASAPQDKASHEAAWKAWQGAGVADLQAGIMDFAALRDGHGGSSVERCVSSAGFIASILRRGLALVYADRLGRGATQETDGSGLAVPDVALLSAAELLTAGRVEEGREALERLTTKYSNRPEIVLSIAGWAVRGLPEYPVARRLRSVGINTDLAAASLKAILDWLPIMGNADQKLTRAGMLHLVVSKDPEVWREYLLFVPVLVVEAEKGGTAGWTALPSGFYKDVAHARAMRVYGHSPRASIELLQSALGEAGPGLWPAAVADAHEELALSFKELGEKERACRELRVSLEEASNPQRVLTELVELLLEVGRAKSALDLLNSPRAVGLDAHTRGMLHVRTLDSLGRTDEAIAEAKALIAGDPDDAESRGWLGFTLNRRSQPEKALEQFLRAVKLEPWNDLWRAGLGIAGYNAGRLDLAADNLPHVRRLFPDQADVIEGVLRDEGVIK